MSDFVFLIWKPEGYGFRLELFAREFGTTLTHSWKPKLFGIRMPVPVRYLLQSLDTYRRLKALRPEVVVTQTPPWPAVLTVWLYCTRFGAQFITDNHTSTFTDWRWLLFNRIDRFFFRRATVNIAHNHKNLEQLAAWGARNPMLIRSPAMRREEILNESVSLDPVLAEHLKDPRIKILYVNRFTPVNCWQEVFDAARLMPEALFFVTGDPKSVGLDPATVPDNVVLPGYMERAEFIHLMDAVDIVLSLTKLKDALAWTYRDCLALRKPFVGTRNEVALANFGEYGCFTTPDPSDIAANLREVWERREEFIPKMAAYIEEDKERWQRDMAAVREAVKDRAGAD